MPPYSKQISALRRIVITAEKLISSLENEPQRSSGRRRRSATEAKKMRAEILKARAKGVSVTKLAEKYGVTTAYVYMIRD